MDENQKFDSSLNDKEFFPDTIKIIAYRAESAMANLIKTQMSNPEQARSSSMLRKFYSSDADIEVDKVQKILNVKLHRSNHRADDKVLEFLCQHLNDTQSMFPASDLTLCFSLL